jgi:GNAT superfamily N-acetyltransferase
MRFASPLLTRRATDLIAAGCRDAGETVLLPALYCAEVADAIVAAGCVVHCYDLMPDLSGSPLPADAGARVLIWHHPFGRYLPVPRRPGMTVIEDACFSLRTTLAMPELAEPELMVFSPRKEFGWVDGGLAVGRRAKALYAAVDPPDRDLAARWHDLDWRAKVAQGQAASAYAVKELGALLPPGGASDRDILTVLPLFSARRDALIEELRAKGIGAWCWQRLMAGCTREATPRAWSIWRRLVLLPLPLPGSPVYGLIRSLGFEPWPGW